MMGAVSRISRAAKSRLLGMPWSHHSRVAVRCSHPFPCPRPSPSCRVSIRPFSSDGYFSDGLSEVRENMLLSTARPVRNLSILNDLRSEIDELAAELLVFPDNADLQEVLDSSSASSFLERSEDGVAFVELLSQLQSRPKLALEVFRWRRGFAQRVKYPLLPEEYVKAITIAGRAGDIELAVKFFEDATSSGLRSTSTYNALMTVYMYNELVNKASSVFDDLRKDDRCCPTIVTYNILLSICGRSFFVERMEDTMCRIMESNLPPTIKTYNYLIAGYLTAGMWDKMERTFKEMEKSTVKPDTSTYLLMLRGYAHADNLEMMEKMFEMVREHVLQQETVLIRTMICAYCRGSIPDRVKKIEDLMEHNPKDQYRPWLNVLLIRLYANEGLVDKMETLIAEAFDHHTVITTVSIMKSIITGYFRCDAVDKLAEFIERAELEGWRLCRSLYHCKMVMYGKQQRFSDMHKVLDEMECFDIFPCKKTFWIMFKAYMNFGKRLDAQRILGLMWKHGFTFPKEILS